MGTRRKKHESVDISLEAVVVGGREQEKGAVAVVNEGYTIDSMQSTLQLVIPLKRDDISNVEIMTIQPLSLTQGYIRLHHVTFSKDHLTSSPSHQTYRPPTPPSPSPSQSPSPY